MANSMESITSVQLTITGGYLVVLTLLSVHTQGAPADQPLRPVPIGQPTPADQPLRPIPTGQPTPADRPLRSITPQPTPADKPLVSLDTIARSTADPPRFSTPNPLAVTTADIPLVRAGLSGRDVPSQQTTNNPTVQTDNQLYTTASIEASLQLTTQSTVTLTAASNAVGTADKPLLTTDNTPLTVTADRPLGTDKTPLNVTVDRPMSVTGKTLLNVTADRPLSVTDKTPLNVTADRPLLMTNKTQLNVTADRPLSVTGKTPLNGTADPPFKRLNTSRTLTTEPALSVTALQTTLSMNNVTVTLEPINATSSYIPGVISTQASNNDSAKFNETTGFTETLIVSTDQTYAQTSENLTHVPTVGIELATTLPSANMTQSGVDYSNVTSMPVVVTTNGQNFTEQADVTSQAGGGVTGATNFTDVPSSTSIPKSTTPTPTTAITGSLTDQTSVRGGGQTPSSINTTSTVTSDDITTTSLANFTSPPDNVTSLPGLVSGVSDVWMIVIGASAGVLVILLILLVICCARRRGHTRDKKKRYLRDDENVMDYAYHPRRPTNNGIPEGTVKNGASLRHSGFHDNPMTTNEDEDNNIIDATMKPAVRNYFHEGIRANGTLDSNTSDELDTLERQHRGLYDKNYVVRREKKPSIPMRAISAKSRMSMGPIMLGDVDSDTQPSTQKTYDKMYSGHSTFRK